MINQISNNKQKMFKIEAPKGAFFICKNRKKDVQAYSFVVLYKYRDKQKQTENKMIELVFFGMIGMLGLWMREVHNSRQTVKTAEFKRWDRNVRKELIKNHLRNK